MKLLISIVLIASIFAYGDPGGGEYDVVLDLANVRMDSIASRIGVRFIGMPLFVHTKDARGIFGAIARTYQDSVCLILADMHGQPVLRTNAVLNLTTVIGRSVSALKLGSDIYLTGTSPYAYLLSEDSLSIRLNPLRKEAILSRFRDVPLDCGVGPWGDTIPSYRVQGNHLLVVSRLGVLQVYDTSGARLYSKTLPLPPGTRSFDDYVTFWEMPVIGIFGGRLFLWERDRLVTFDTCSASLVETPLDSLFRPEAFGEIVREAEGVASGYYVEDESFFVFLQTDRKVLGFKWKGSK
jgi:hypothetical protein